MPTKTPPLEPTVAALLAELRHPQEPTIRAIRGVVLGADARIGEGIKWNAPSFHLAGDHFATFNLRSRDTVQLVLHLGARPRPDARIRDSLGEAGSRLEWKSADRAILSIGSLAEAKEADKPLRAIIREWLRHV